MHSGAPFAKKGGAELTLPNMDIPISLMQWEVFLPEQFKVKDFGGNVIAANIVPVAFRAGQMGDRQTYEYVNGAINNQPFGTMGPGQVGGYVVDPSGTAVANAQVSIVSVDNGQNRNNFGPRDNDQYRYGNNYGPYGSNRGRNFDRDEFNRRYYGRYGEDPNNFERNRLRYRAAQRWRERYPHDYVYADDSFYRDCRSNNEVGGAVVGAILGGILGNAVSHGQGGATLAGVIIGGVGGASLAGNLDCEDRSYVYQTYYDGFERGRSRASYPWRNERTGDYGNLLVGDYYQDRDNYRCATYTQTIYVRGTPQVARGHACRQDDGTWALVD